MIVRFAIAGRLLVAASILLTNSGAPGVCHAHADGDRPHEHRATKHHHHKHHHHGHSHAKRDRQSLKHAESPTVCRCSHSGRHLHISWFGLNFTLPSPSDENESTDGSHGSTQLVIVRPFDVTATAKPGEPSFGATLFALAAVQGADLSIQVLALPDFSSTPIAVASLCDTARHERSGVQLS